MMPILIYDFQNGFPQTLKFFAWMILEILGLFGINILPKYPHQSFSSFSIYFLDEFREIIFAPNVFVSSLILLVVVLINLIFIYKLYKKNKLKQNYIVFYFCISILIAGFFSQRAESSAYMTMIYSYVIIFVSLSVNYFSKMNKIILTIILVIIFPILNSRYILNQYEQLKDVGFRLLTKQAEFIVNDAKGESFYLTRKNFKSNIEIDQYRYMVWWKGGKLDVNSRIEYGIYNATEGKPQSYIYEDGSIYITKTEKKIIVLIK